MSAAALNLEQAFFRRLNAIVEPAVRRGIGSPAWPPAALILLETTGYKTGLTRRTPLWSLRLGRYRLVATFRGERSFWVRNLQRQPRVSYYLAGKCRRARAHVVSPRNPTPLHAQAPAPLRALSRLLAQHAPAQWTFAILAPTAR